MSDPASQVTDALDLYADGVPVVDIARRCGVHPSTVHRWVKGLYAAGARGRRGTYQSHEVPTGAVRAEVAAGMKRLYETEGASISDLAELYQQSYGTTRRLLVEAGTVFRPSGRRSNSAT